MDSSYGNSGQNASGAPGTKPSVTMSGSGVNPGVTMSGSGTNPGMGVNNPNVSGAQMPRPTGDIVLNGGESERSGKRGLLVAGMALIGVVLVVVIIVLIVMGGRGSNNSNIDKVAFNRLINYVTSGTESTADIDTEYKPTGGYYLLDGWETEEERDTIYTKTKELMDNFSANYKDGDNEVLNDSVKFSKEMFDFIYALSSKERFYNIEATLIMIKDGPEKAKQDLMNRFLPSGLDGNMYAEDFVETYNDYLDALADKIEAYRENDCIVSDYINDECMKNKSAEDFSNVNKFYSDVVYYYDLADNFVGIIYDINDLLHGKSLTITGVGDEGE